MTSARQAEPAATPITPLRRGLERVGRWMLGAGGWMYIACSVFVTFDVLARSFLGFSSKTTTEITGYMLAFGMGWSFAFTLTERAHIRIDVLVNRLPLGVRQYLHAIALLLLGVFAVFIAWAAWSVVQESLEFDAHDNSAMSIPLVLPQGLWAFGIVMFAAMVLVLCLETAILLARNDAVSVDRLLGPRTFQDETDEALEAVGARPATSEPAR
ncbi:MAG: TRAP transporter small permease [Alphaproteobacteria bacterium]|nr:TRAP transporter small permease [Alphaproteobacteria bacterium]